MKRNDGFVAPSTLRAKDGYGPWSCAPPPAWFAYWETCGRGSEAAPLLAKLIESFTEGLDTTDVRQAQKVLGELD